MQVEQSAIKRYKINRWYHGKSRDYLFGVDVVMDSGSVYHVCDDSGEVFFKTYGEALSTVRKWNKELKTQTTNP